VVARRSCHAQQKISWTRAVDLRHRTARRAWRLTGRRAVGWTGDGHRYDHRRADKTEPGKRLHSRHALHHAYQHGLLTPDVPSCGSTGPRIARQLAQANQTRPRLIRFVDLT